MSCMSAAKCISRRIDSHIGNQYLIRQLLELYCYETIETIAMADKKYPKAEGTTGCIITLNSYDVIDIKK